MRVTFLLPGGLGVGLLVVACGEILSPNEDDTGPAVTPPSSAAAAADGGVAESGDSTSIPDGASPPTCRDVSFTPLADTCLYGCGGSNSAGAYPMCNTGVGPLVANFKLDPETAEDLRGGHATKISLTLADNRTCDGDAGPDDCGNVGPQPGILTAHVATNNWVEGPDRAGYSGADGCRRNAGSTTGIGWGSTSAAPSPATKVSSPADYGGEIGRAAIKNDTVTLDIAMDPSLVSANWKTYAPGGGGSDAGATRLTLLVNGESGRLVIGTRESKRVAPPKLSITICKE